MKEKKREIVPAYKTIKKEASAKKKTVVIRSKLTVVMIGALVLCGIIGIILLIWYINTLKWKPYAPYEQQMKTFVFDKVYDNGSAKTSQSVTKSEAIKMALAATYNTSDISGFSKETVEQYSNARWVAFAKAKKVIAEDEITKENADEKATYIEVIRYFANARVQLLKKNIDASTKPNLKDFENYNPEEQNIIADSIVNNLITIQNNKLRGNDKVSKGQVNELVVRYIQKYNTIAPEGEKLNINPEKIPSNAEQYPYTLANVDKQVYEQPFQTKREESVKQPKEVYRERKELYGQIESTVESYYNSIVNIDYNTISEEELKNKMDEYTINGVDVEKIKEYVDYVKKNKIMLSGEAKVQFPIIYFDGVFYRARTKLTFQIDYSDTKENLLYRDLDFLTSDPQGIVTYKENAYVLIIDVLLTKPSDIGTLYIEESSIFDCLVDKNQLYIRPTAPGGEYRYEL